MIEDKKKLSKEELKSKLDALGEEIKYRVAEAKKAEGTGVGSAHKTDLVELMKQFRVFKEAYGKVINAEKESLQLEDILASLAEEKEEDPKKGEEREELHQTCIDSFVELTELVVKIKSALPKAKRQTEQYYKKNPNSFAIVFPTDQLKGELEGILEKLTGEEKIEEQDEKY